MPGDLRRDGSGSWEIRVDTGGTFTDCVARDPEGETRRAKVLSTSALRGTVAEGVSAETVRTASDPVELQIEEGWGAPTDFIAGFQFHLHGREGPVGRVEGYEPEEGRLRLEPLSDEEIPSGATFEVRSPEPAPLLAARLITGTPAGEALPELALRLATTRATNALLERRGAPLALFVTRGFAHLLEIGNQQRPDLFALDIRKPRPLPRRVVEVSGRLAADGSEVERLTVEGLEEAVRELQDEGIEAAAVALLHSYRNGEHENEVARVLEEAGMAHVAVSNHAAPFIHLLRRAETAAVEGYLGPVIRRYVDRIGDALPEENLLVMTSAGGLVRGRRVRARDTLLSGPAGGVVGAALVGRRAGLERVIAFDMGGTSTDVSRYDGEYEYLEEHQVGDARLRAPALAIETVAAGGGSVCDLDPNGLKVGPESAGADPGPACYGAGGPLTLTDVNLLLGRLDPARFGIPVSEAPARDRAEEILHRLRERTGEETGLEALLEGFLELANERMADAIRRISVRKGYDPAEYALVAFGGAGPQHACALAARLGIGRVLVPADAGVLSAVGLGHAVVERFAHRQVLDDLESVTTHLPEWFEELESRARAEVEEEGVPAERIRVRQRVAHLRYRGQESTLEVPFPQDSVPAHPSADPSLPSTADIRRAFEEAYEAVYGHRAERRPVEVESLRVVASDRPVPVERFPEPSGPDARPVGRRKAFVQGGWRQVPIYHRSELEPGARFRGPALIRDRYSTTVLDAGWRGRMDGGETLVLERDADSREGAEGSRARAVEEELFVQRFRALVTEMGEQLRRTSLSVNIRERLDFSCALLDPQGRLVANAPHIPVHLGAMGLCVRRVAKTLELGAGDVAVTNHPGYGGSHLPDITVITPVFHGSVPRLLGYVASRAHHAELGGTRPGSMPPDARSLQDEGVVIDPRRLVKSGIADWDGMRELLSAGPHPSRTVEENLVDLAAQVAANHRGARLLSELADDAGTETVLDHMTSLRERAAGRMRTVLGQLEDGSYPSRELLDDGTPLQVEIRIEGAEAVVDFTGSGPVHPGNLNATEAIVRSATLYVLRLLAREELPLNEGLMEPVRLVLPEGILNPPFPDDAARCPAVVGGNVETSQRLVDTLLKPFGLAACSQGTMNNLLFGDDTSSYYETVGGGSGAGPDFHGSSGVQVHMTNTRITDAEVLEHRYPVRVHRFGLREDSGGRGRWNGGEGVVRELEFLRPFSVSVLTQHRKVPPYGLEGGGDGAVGRQRVIRASGDELELKPVDGVEVEPGDRIVLETPGGGGYGDSGEGQP